MKEKDNLGVLLVRGKEIAQEIIDELKKQARPKKFLAAFLVGEDPASVSFIKQKEKTAKEIGVDFRIYTYPADIKNDSLRKEVLKIALHKTCGGAIVQLPLPEHINKHYILNVVPREKDVDVLGERALGAFYTGRNPVLPPAVGAVEKILSDANITRIHANDANEYLKDKKVAVVGLGLLVGKPIAHWLMDKVADLYLVSERSDLTILKQADLVISGVGEAWLIKPEMLKEGAGVIDFGCTIVDGKVLGDFDTSQLEIGNWKLGISFYTPTPGGTGPILVAQLFQNFYRLNKKSQRHWLFSA